MYRAGLVLSSCHGAFALQAANGNGAVPSMFRNLVNQDATESCSTQNNATPKKTREDYLNAETQMFREIEEQKFGNKPCKRDISLDESFQPGDEVVITEDETIRNKIKESCKDLDSVVNCAGNHWAILDDVWIIVDASKGDGAPVDVKVELPMGSFMDYSFPKEYLQHAPEEIEEDFACLNAAAAKGLIGTPKGYLPGLDKKIKGHSKYNEALTSSMKLKKHKESATHEVFTKGEKVKVIESWQEILADVHHRDMDPNTVKMVWTVLSDADAGLEDVYIMFKPKRYMFGGEKKIAYIGKKYLEKVSDLVEKNIPLHAGLDKK